MIQRYTTGSRPETQEPVLIVTWTIGPQVYGLPVADVVEVVRVPAMLTLAGAPEYVCGLLNRHGQYLPVLDGRALLDEPLRYDLASQVVIVGNPLSAAERRAELGLLVDQVCEVRMFHAGRLVPLAPSAARPFLRGVINADEGSILLLDAARLAELAPQLDNTIARGA